MYDVQMVAVSDGSDYLAEVIPGPVLPDAVRHLVEVVQEVPPVTQLQDQVELVLGGDHVIEPHYVRVPYQLHALYLANSMS